MKRHLGLAAALVGIVSLAAVLNAQNAQDDGQPRQRQDRRQGDGGGDRRGDFMARMTERMKEQLDVTDEEWGVLQPKVEKVLTAQRDARGGFGFGGRGGFGGGPGGDQADTPVRKASEDLRAALDAEGTSAQEIATKLAALREARKKAQADLEAARKELRELLTQRQEAVFVMMGTLE